MTFLVKIGRLASEEVVLQLVNSKCTPALLYGLVGFRSLPLEQDRSQILRFLSQPLFMKLLRTNDLQTIMECQSYFGFQLECYAFRKIETI